MQPLFMHSSKKFSNKRAKFRNVGSDGETERAFFYFKSIHCGSLKGKQTKIKCGSTSCPTATLKEVRNSAPCSCSSSPLYNLLQLHSTVETAVFFSSIHPNFVEKTNNFSPEMFSHSYSSSSFANRLS